MNIGISCYPTFGGSGVVASELGMGLAERGHEVHFITYAVPGRLKLSRPGIYYHEVTVPEYPLFEYPPYSLALSSKMAEVAQKQKLNIIHAHYAIPHAASAVMAREMSGGSFKVVTTLHGTDITLVGKDPSFMPVTKFSIERSDMVTAVSKYLHDEVCRTFTCHVPVEIIPNFIDPRDFTRLNPVPIRNKFAPNGEALLVHVSNFRPVKRVRDVIAVFLALHEKIPVRLILVGAGPDLAIAEELVRRGGAEDDLIMLGNTDAVLEIVSACDIFLLPSDSESFGLAALEAMACGVPVIGTSAGGLPEVVEEGVSGFLRPVGDVKGMATAARKLLSNKALHKTIADQARGTALSKFSISALLDKYEDVYRRAL